MDDNSNENANTDSVENQTSLDLINGPVNVVRLEGEIEGVHKVLYLFFDTHLRRTSQSKCDNIFATDIQHYLVDNLMNKPNSGNKTYDFFMETDPIDFPEAKLYIDADGYIWSVNKVFARLFKKEGLIEVSNDISNEISNETPIETTPETSIETPNPLTNPIPSTGSKMVSSPGFDNVRLHFMDIRDYLERMDVGFNGGRKRSTMAIIDSFMGSFFNKKINRELDFITIASFRDFLKQLLSSATLILEIMKSSMGPDFIPAKESVIKLVDIERNSAYEEKFLEYMENLTKKMVTSYSHPKVKSDLEPMIEQIMGKFEMWISYLNEVITHLERISNIPKFKNRLVNYGQTVISKSSSSYVYFMPVEVSGIYAYELFDISTKISATHTKTYSYFMDLYFYRRFLDKSYITNGIVYAGANHCLRYMYYLVSKFDFEITHVAKSKIKGILEINALVKNAKSAECVAKNFDSDLQCSDLSDFPRDFL